MENEEVETATQIEEQPADTATVVNNELLNQIKELKEQLKQQQEQHNKEIKEIITSIKGANNEKPKSEEDLMCEQVIERVNKYRR